MSLGPFFSPALGMHREQERAWFHRCDSFGPIEVILAGRHFNPDGQVPRATFCHGPAGHRQKLYEYVMTQDEHDKAVHHFSRVELSGDAYPPVQDVFFRFDNNRIFGAKCDTPNASASAPCMDGSFDETGYLSLTINDTRSNTSRVTQLTAVDPNWVPFSPVDDAPSYILADANGEWAVRTAVTKKGDCTSLKLCLKNKTVQVFDALPAVGLTLYYHDQYARVCTTPSSN